MGNTIKMPHEDQLLGAREGVRAYFLDAGTNPLYRGCKLISEAPIVHAKRTAYLSWIVYRGEFVRIGDAHLLLRDRPELANWLTGVMAENFNMVYLREDIGLTDSEIEALIKADKVKYPRK